MPGAASRGNRPISLPLCEGLSRLRGAVREEVQQARAAGGKRGALPWSAS